MTKNWISIFILIDSLLFGIALSVFITRVRHHWKEFQSHSSGILRPPQLLISSEEKPVAAKTSASAPETPAASSSVAGPVVLKKRKIQFRYWDANARTVKLAGSFLEEGPIAFQKKGPTLWETEHAVPPGTHTYQFLVNGVPYPDPNNPRKKENRSILVVQPHTD
ncbi:MAG: hypothetical protein HY402_01330 [Elusimicrobia bacterium]|nr:hypothetical protein [Elusimicrobiota bacterium]